MYLDLSKGQKITLNPNHNCQGAKQPVYLHIGSKEPHVYRGSVRQPGPGEGHVVRYSPKHGGWKLQIEGVSIMLGGWWLQAALKGKLYTIPVVNLDPVVLDQDGAEVDFVLSLNRKRAHQAKIQDWTHVQLQSQDLPL